MATTLRYLTFDELIESFEAPARERLFTLLGQQGTAGMAVYECADMWSSNAGKRQALVFGAAHTFFSPESVPPRIGDVPSRFHDLLGVYVKPEGDTTDWLALAEQAKTANLSSLVVMTPKQIEAGLRLVNEEGDGFVVIMQGAFEKKAYPFSVCPIEYYNEDAHGESIPFWTWKYISDMCDQGYTLVRDKNYLVGRLEVPTRYREKETAYRTTIEPDYVKGKRSAFDLVWEKRDSLPILKRLLESGQYYIKDDGIIRYPMSLRGQPLWVAYFYELAGISDWIDLVENVYIFDVDADDVTVFPELKGMEYVGVLVTDSGFIEGLTGSDLPVAYGGEWVPNEDEEDFEG